MKRVAPAVSSLHSPLHFLKSKTDWLHPSLLSLVTIQVCSLLMVFKRFSISWLKERLKLAYTFHHLSRVHHNPKVVFFQSPSLSRIRREMRMTHWIRKMRRRVLKKGVICNSCWKWINLRINLYFRRVSPRYCDKGVSCRRRSSKREVRLTETMGGMCTQIHLNRAIQRVQHLG